MEILTKSAQETKRFGEKFANNLKGGEIVALVGDLGNGKTTFVQGLAQGLGIKDRIISPTFILRRDYEVRSKKQKAPVPYGTGQVKRLSHIDLYRLEENIEKEFRNLGTDELFGSSDTIAVIEWAEKVKEVLPKSTIWIKFENLGEDKRRIKISNIK